MNNKLAVLAITGTFLLNATAGELFPERKPVEFTKDAQLDSASTIGGYPIYRGDGGWRISSLNLNATNALGEATEIPLGMVKLVQLEPSGDWFASQQVAANLRTTVTNQYSTGSPCSGIHLIAIHKGRGKDDNCVTVDVSSFQSGNKSTTYFSLLSTQNRDSGRRYIVGIQLNAELLGFRETAPADWTNENVNNEPSRKLFVERLKKWAEMLQDATARAVEYDAPKDVFAGIPSYRTLLPVPTDLSDGTYTQQFIGAVESTRYKKSARAIAFTKVSPTRTKWANQYAMDDQASADKLALEVCERGRPTAAEPCKLYDLDKAVPTVTSSLQSGAQLGAASFATPAQQEQNQSPLTRVLSQDEGALVGRWVGRDSKGILGWFEFRQNGDADFSIDGKSFKKSVIGNSGTLLFKVNAGAIPWSMDLIGTRNDGKELTLPCIVDFVDTGGLNLRCSYSGTRPTSFEGANENEFIRLSKQK